MDKVKIIANYLPQYHSIPENDKWWGKDYTDWSAVQKSTPLFKGHNQPRRPLNGEYYRLDNYSTIKRQVDLANQYGVYGFAIYHYWFSENMNLLTKPAEIIKDNEDLNINYLFIWDNCTWRRTWSNIKYSNDWAPKFDDNPDKSKDNGILAELKYGNQEEWKKHFISLLPYFNDKRYIKIDGKPIFGFFQTDNDFGKIEKMAAYWDQLAREYGLDGVICMTRKSKSGAGLKYQFKYTPLFPDSIGDYIRFKIYDIFCQRTNHIRKFEYDNVWKEIIKNAKKTDRYTFLSGFVGFDDSPRRGNKGRIIVNGSVEKFQKYMKELVEISEKQNKEYLFITAWNEWGEGAYLEPDSVNEYQYLEALKAVQKI